MADTRFSVLMGSASASISFRFGPQRKLVFKYVMSLIVEQRPVPQSNGKELAHLIHRLKVRMCEQSVRSSHLAHWHQGRGAETVFLSRRKFKQGFTDGLSEVDRAVDNLNKSGKLFNPPSRRESMPMMGVGRPMSEFGMLAKFYLSPLHSDHRL